MMKYQTCNLSSSARKARDFNASTMSAHSLHSVKQVGAPSIPAHMKHQVKLAKLDLSQSGIGPGQKLASRSPEHSRSSINSMFGSHHGLNNSRILAATPGGAGGDDDAPIEEEEKEEHKTPLRTSSKVNPVARELDFKQRMGV